MIAGHAGGLAGTRRRISQSAALKINWGDRPVSRGPGADVLLGPSNLTVEYTVTVKYKEFVCVAALPVRAGNGTGTGAGSATAGEDAHRHECRCGTKRPAMPDDRQDVRPYLVFTLSWNVRLHRWLLTSKRSVPRLSFGISDVTRGG